MLRLRLRHHRGGVGDPSVAIHGDRERGRHGARCFFCVIARCGRRRRGSTEPLIDEVCDAQIAGNSIEETTFLRVLKTLVDQEVRFVIWHGSDHSEIPVTRTWVRIVEAVREQITMQPADLYLYFAPPATGQV